MQDVHQIWHGDSIELCQKFKPGWVNCVVTDPPFGIDNLSKQAVTVHGKQYARKIANDNSPAIAMRVFNEVMDVLLPKTADEADLYIFTAYEVLKEWLQLADDLSRHGFIRKALLVWEKDGPGMGDLDSWGQGHELIIFLKKGKRERTDKRRSGVLHVPQIPPGKLIHPHEKPLPLLEILLKHSTSKGDFVVDPFSGSGSLVRAAKQCGRNAVGIELDEKNFELSIKALNGTASGFDFGD